MTSLRRRIFIGSLLWTAGMILVASLFFTMLMEHSPHARRIADVHRFFQSPLTQALGIFSLLAGAYHVRRGLKQVDALRSDLAGLREQRGRRLDGDYPGEIQPLVNDLNSLLDTREKAIERAAAKAGDLAHGLKTPLAILAQDGDRARAAGQGDIAASINHQVSRMKRQIDYHLSQARAAAAGGTATARTPVLESADGLRRAMLRLFADRGIAIDIQVAPEIAVRVQREDLDEMLGNLVENACKWARGRVVVSADGAGGAVTIVVDDDGSGLPEDMCEAVLQRGVRADQAAPGTGLGLAIVRDLAELYGGSITLKNGPNGGLRAELRLPA